MYCQNAHDGFHAVFPQIYSVKILMNANFRWPKTHADDIFPDPAQQLHTAPPHHASHAASRKDDPSTRQSECDHHLPFPTLDLIHTEQD